MITLLSFNGERIAPFVIQKYQLFELLRWSQVRSLQLIMMLEVFCNCSYFKLASPLGKTLDCALLKGQSKTHTDKLSTFKDISFSQTKQGLWFPFHSSEKSATPKYCSYLCRPVHDFLILVLEGLRECLSKAQCQILRIL